MPAVSVLIPSYNHARYLPACLESVQSQTMTDWEVVLVDDGSTDESLGIAEGFAKRDSRVQVHINSENLGTYGTLTQALQMCHGEFVAVLNSDDVWTTDKLARQMDLLSRHAEARYCYTLGWMVDEEGSLDESSDVHANWPQEEVHDALPFLLSENRILASSVLFRRHGLRFSSHCRYSGDWIALLEQSYSGPACCIPERLTFWRQHSANTYRRSLHQVLEEIAVRKAIGARKEEWLSSRSDIAPIWEGLARNELNLHALYILCGEVVKAREAIGRARALDPRSVAIRRRSLLSMLPLKLQQKRLWKGEQLEMLGSHADSRGEIGLRLSKPWQPQPDKPRA